MGKGKKSGNAGLGKSLIKDTTRAKRFSGGASWLHTSELGDGYEWGRLNFQSVTEETTLDDFLRTAQLAGTEFQAERMNAKIVTPRRSDLHSEEERMAIRKAEEENKQYLSIPRRPTWDASTSAEKLDMMERESFLAWRRNLALLQENENLVLTPFEKNLEFWRQLWRVVERSDVIVQIVDARNPLLYRCEDLERYVKEISSHKVNAVLMNKSDLLTAAQREMWAEYFEGVSLPCAFWSATGTKEQQESVSPEEEEEEEVEVVGGSLMKDEGRSADVEVGCSDVEEMDLVGENRYELLGDVGGEESDTEEGGGSLPPPTVQNEDTPVLGARQSIEAEDQDVDGNIHHGWLPPPVSGVPVEGDLLGERKDTPQPPSLSDSVQSGGQEGMQSLEMIMLPRSGKEMNMRSNDGDRKVVGNVVDDGGNVSNDGENVIDDGRASVVEVGEAGAQEPGAKVRGVTVSDPEAALRENSTPQDKHTDSPLLRASQPVEAVPLLKSRVLTRQELLDFFRTICPKKKDETRLQVGLVGYPNVGKSSTINVLYQEKKTPVSATPGRTKHFQTLLVEDDICLCDSPGLVFPTFVNTKAEMICSGILPIDQMRDPLPPVTLICQRLPRHVLCTTYGLYLPPPEEEGAEPNDPPTAEEFLSAYAFERGFMTHKGNPDQQRAARHILKDYVSGKLLYCHPPPGVTPEDFNLHLCANHPPRSGDWGKTQAKVDSILAATIDTGVKPRTKQAYTSQNNVEVVSKGAHGLRGFTRTEGFVHHHGLLATGVAGEMEEMEEEVEGSTVSASCSSHLSYSSVTRPGLGDKPWKKHHNRNKKEKVRRQVKMRT